MGRTKIISKSVEKKNNQLGKKQKREVKKRGKTIEESKSKKKIIEKVKSFKRGKTIKAKKIRPESSDEENNKSNISIDEEKEKSKRGRKKKETSTKKIIKTNLKTKKIIKEKKEKSKKEKKNINKKEIKRNKSNTKIIEKEKKNKSSSKNIKKKEENISEEKKIESKKNKKASKTNLKTIDIKLLPEDEYLSIKSDKLINDCCIICNEKNIFRAIKNNNKKLLELCLKSTKEIYSINYNLPMLKYLTPLEYCLKCNNKEMFSILLNYFKKSHSRVKPPISKLNYLNSGKQSIYTFGFKTRHINLSRGNKLGNNAFLEESNKYETYDNYNMKKFYTKINQIQAILFKDDEIFEKFKSFTKIIKLDEYQILNLIYENIDKGNINIVEYLLNIFQTKENYGFNKLHSLVSKQKKTNNLEIKNKASTNKITLSIQITPVHISCINPNEKILEELIEKGGEIEFQDGRGKKPISYAATCKGTGPLKLLLKKKCNVNDREKNGFTPILHACRTGRYDNVKLLLENGANFLHKPKPGMNMTIHYSCMNDNYLDIVKLLFQYNNDIINMNGSGKMTPLHFAVENNCEKIVEFLVENNCKIDCGDKFKRTPLLLAAKYGYTRILNYLILKGSNVNKCDNSNNSPLHYACAFGNMECVKLLIENKAKVNELNMWKTLPIEIALLKNHFGIVKYLLNNESFEIDTPFSNGNNILFQSIIDIGPETLDEIKYFINEKKANVNYCNDNKMNALHFLSNFTYRVYISNFTDFEEKKKLNEEKHKEYIKSYKKTLKEYIKLFIDNGCDCDLKNNIGQSPLLVALENNSFYFAIELIDLCKDKINISHLDNNNLGIFDYCGKNGNIFKEECIEFINKVIEIYPKIINDEFLNKYTRYGKNAILSLCSDYAEYFYERFYYLSKVNSVKYVKTEKVKNKITYKLKSSNKDKIIDETLKSMNDYLNNKFYPLLNKLISLGADINSKTEKKKFINDKNENEYFNDYGKITPLMYLLSYPYSAELIKLINKNNIDINSKDILGKTPFMYLIYNRNQIKNISENEYDSMFDFFNNNNKIEIESIDLNGNSIISLCLFKHYYKDSLKIYKKHKLEVNVNRTNNSNKNALLEELNVKNKSNINFILTSFKEKIDTNNIDLKYNRNALHYTCINTLATDEIDFEIFADLIKAKTSISQKDIYERTPLFYLFIDGKNKTKIGDPISSLSYLLENYQNEININDVDINGNSLLFLAVNSNAIFCVSTLLSKGALIKNIKNKNNNNIFSLALLSNSNSIPELYSKVNDVNVFKEKMYENSHFFENEVEKKFENKNENEKNLNDDTLENFFNNKKYKAIINDYNDNWRYKNNDDNEGNEKDMKLEKLFEDENEGVERVLNFNWENQSNEIGENILFNKEDEKDNEYSNKDEEEEEEEYKGEEEEEEEEENKEEDDNISNKNNDNDNDMDVDSNDDNLSEEEENYDLEKISDRMYFFNYIIQIKNTIESVMPKDYGNSIYKNRNKLMLKDKEERENEDRKNKSKSIYFPIKKMDDDDDDDEEDEEEETEEEEQNKSDNKIICNSLFKYCIEKNKQDIIFYVLNQGYDIFSALQESIECKKFNFSIALTERINETNIKKLQGKNSKGQNLIHILCKNKEISEEKNSIKKLYDILINKIKINNNEYDNNGHTPLYYACLNENYRMLVLITQHLKLKQMLLDDKNPNETPFKILYQRFEFNNNGGISFFYDISKDLKIGYLNYVTKFLAKNYKKEMKEEFSISKMENNSKSSIAINQIIALYELLINECKINIMSKDSELNDSFSYCALYNNYDFMFDILMKEKNIKYDEVNNKGKSLIHLLITPDGIGSYQNETFLEKAIESGFKYDIKDFDNKTPLDYSIEYNYENLTNILLKAYNLNEKDINMKEENNNSIIIKYNYEEDSENYYKNIIQPFMNIKNVENKNKLLETLVTKQCDLKRENYRVCVDENNIPYNINLSKVDINRYQYGEFFFYKIQLLHNIKRNMFNLITRWGRFGEIGLHQNTPFITFEEGVKEFKKVFSSKTGNDWDKIKNNFDSFEKKNKKFNLVKLTTDQPDILNITQFFNKEMKNIKFSHIKSNIENEKIRDLFNYLIVNAFNSRFGNKNRHYYSRRNYYNNENEEQSDFSMMYFKEESLNKAFQILNEIGDNINKITKLKDNKKNLKISEKELSNEKSDLNKILEELKECNKKILHLSNEYYELIPFTKPINEFISPINNMNLLKEEIDKCKSYSYIEKTLKLFLGSLNYIDKINPIDYIYESLGIKIINLNIEEKKEKISEAKYLIDYIKMTYNLKKNRITNIFKIENSINDIKFNPENKKNRVLLFHGTKIQNILGILSQGLLISPIEASSSGSLYGNGIYLSDSFKKSIDYSDNYNKNYVLIVECALGNYLQLSEKKKFVSVDDLKNKGYDSIISDAQIQMNFDNIIYLKNGCGIFTQLKDTEKKKNNYFQQEYAEYVVYNENLVKVKYLVEISNC